jgi:hypothetical protein
MSKQENFNDILRSKFTERETPVNEEDWRKMRKTIDDSRNRKRRILWVASSMLGLLLCFGIYEYITFKNTSEPIVTLNSKTVPMAANQSNDIKNVNSNTATAIPVEKVKTENTKETAPINAPKVAGTVSNKTSTASVEQKQKSSVKTESVTGNANYTASTKTRKQLSAEHNKANKTSSDGSTATMNAVANSAALQKNKDASYQDKASTVEVNDASITANSSAINKKPDSPKNQTLSESINSTSANPQPKGVTKKSDSVLKNQNVADAGKNIITPSKSDSAAKKADSIPPIKAVSEMVSPLPPIEGKVPSKNSFSIEAGAGYSLGWNYSDTLQGRGFNPTIGIGYTHTISPKFAIKTGLQLSSLSGMGTSPFIIKHVTYDFGYNANDTSLKTNWLFYLTVPLQVEYKLDEKDAIGLGGNLSYLITGYGQVSVSSLAGDVSKTTNTYSQFMYVKGFNQWNSSVFLLYKRTLFGKLSAYLIPYFGLMDIKSNSFFSQNKFERDSGLKLLLSYSIL